MTLLQKIQNLTWCVLDIKLKDILTSIVTTIENTPVAESRPYKVYTALLTQTGTNAPVATVLENTIGDIVWSYFTLATYKATLNGAFLENKVAVQGSANRTIDSLLSGSRLDNNTIIVTSTTISTDTPANDKFSNSFVEIRIYN